MSLGLSVTEFKWLREPERLTELETERNDMTNEEFVRQAYAFAEVKDVKSWVACFNADGVFVDESVGVTYRGPSEVGSPPDGIERFDERDAR